MAAKDIKYILDWEYSSFITDRPMLWGLEGLWPDLAVLRGKFDCDCIFAISAIGDLYTTKAVPPYSSGDYIKKVGIENILAKAAKVYDTKTLILCKNKYGNR